MKKTGSKVRFITLFAIIMVMALILPGCGSRDDQAEEYRDEAAKNYAILQGHDYPSVDDYEAVDKAVGRKEDEDIVFHWREYKDIRDEIAKMIDGGTGTTAEDPSEEPSSIVAQDTPAVSINDLVGMWYLDNNPYPNGRYYMSFHDPSDSTISFTATTPYWQDGKKTIDDRLYNYTATYTIDGDTIHLFFDISPKTNMDIKFNDKTHIESSRWMIYIGTYTKE